MKHKGRLLLGLGLVFLIQAGKIGWTQTTERVSVDSAGLEGNNASSDPSISADGRYVAFTSNSDNLVVGDNNTSRDIFVRDRQTPTTTRVSVDSAGSEGNNASNDPFISADGRYVAFVSDADNLVANDTNGFFDVFVHDWQGGATTRVSVDSAGIEGEGLSLAPSISADGRYVAFDSDADNLVVNDTNGSFDIFVHDRDADGDGTYDEVGGISTVRVSVDSAGSEGNNISSDPSISSDGRYVAFESFADNLVANDTNGRVDIFVHDRDADGDGTYDEVGGISTVRVSVNSAGSEADGDSNSPSISDDGRYVTFDSDATDLVAADNNGKFDIFVHDRDADGDGIYDEVGGVSTERVSVDSVGGEADGHSYSPSISADGRYVAFYSEADNLVANDTNGSFDVFVHDRDADGDGTYDEVGGISTVRVSVDSVGGEGNGISRIPFISADGRYVAFESDADNLVANDTNGFFDIFLYGSDSVPPTVISTSPADSATHVAVDAVMTATFSEAMNASTIDINTFTVDNGVTGTVSYDANSTTATFTPTSDLNYDTTYTATITTDAEDVAGNGLQADYSWSFTTQSEENSGGGGDGRCFIATATSGSRKAEQVKALKDYRDSVLMTNTLGRAFVKFYYKVSPPIANFIDKHGSLRAVVGYSLLPLVGFSWLALKLGTIPTLALVVLLFILMITTVRFSFRHLRPIRHKV